ncbi:MAG TPA: DUF5683 domain-containing protein [Candidatus Krumholzibacteria bacterium]|nr:DUF5683 domain-containing protein [Candidatus Krumholzibacteria bacterium]
MARGKTMRVTAALAAALFVSSASTPVFAEGSSVVRSVLLPGLGQAHDGHYTRATIFASAAIISWTGLFASQVNYSRSVETYENEKRTYLFYPEQIARGQVVQASDIADTYEAMEAAYTKAEDGEKWRNFFIGAVVVTYAVNIVDIILSEPDTGEIQPEPAVSLEWTGDQMRLVRTIRF